MGGRNDACARVRRYVSALCTVTGVVDSLPRVAVDVEGGARA